MIITPQEWIQEPDSLLFGLLLAEAGQGDTSFSLPICTVETSINTVMLGEPQDFNLEFCYLSKRGTFHNEAAYEKWFHRPFNDGYIEPLGIMPADGAENFKPRPVIDVTAKVVKVGNYKEDESYSQFKMMTLACLGHELDVVISPRAMKMKRMRLPQKDSIFCGALRVSGAPVLEMKSPKKARKPKKEPVPAEPLESGSAFEEPEILKEYPVAITSTFRMSEDRSRIAIIDDFNNIYGWYEPSNAQLRLDLDVTAGMMFLHAEPIEMRDEIEGQLLRFFRHTPPGDPSNIRLYYPDHGKLVHYSNGAIWSDSINTENGKFVIPVIRANEDSKKI